MLLLCLLSGDIYAIGASSDSTVVVSVVEPRPYRIVNAWKIRNITVSTSVYSQFCLLKQRIVLLCLFQLYN